MNDDDLQRELERLARSDATSGRRALAKVTAIRTLQRLPALTGSYPVDDDGRFHPGGPDWWDLDRCDPDEVRERGGGPFPRSPAAVAFTRKQKSAQTLGGASTFTDLTLHGSGERVGPKRRIADLGPALGGLAVTVGLRPTE